MALPDVTQNRLLGMMLLVVLVSLEAGAAALAYVTLGWLDCFLYCVAVILNVPLLLLVLWRPLPGALAALALFLLLVPYQAVLGVRLLGLQKEADEIVAYTYAHRLRTGEFPANLEGYETSRPELMRFFQYRLEPQRGGFQLSYWVGSRYTSHIFAPDLGWWYLDD